MESRRPLRIVIASRIFSPEPSAASFMLEAIARRFRDEGHEVTVLTTNPPRGIAATEIDGVRIRRAPVRRDRQGYVRGYLSYLSFDVPLAVRLLLSRRADLYVVEPPPTTGAVTRVITALLRRPYVYDAADLWSDAAQLVTGSRVVIGLLRATELFALRGAAHLFAISRGVVERLGELGVRAPSTVIGFGVDIGAFHYRHPETVAAPHERADVPDAPYIIYPGSYSEWHGAGIFIEAFARLRADHPELRLLFVGNGSDRPVLERRCAELGLDGVEFRDPIEAPRLTTLLANAVVSLASLKPGQGYDYAFTTKIYSSLAAGCPVVFTGTGPTLGFITESAREQPVGTAVEYAVPAVADAIAAVLAAPLEAREREALSGWAHERFSIERAAAIVVETSTRVVAERRARRGRLTES
ncbi:glycosyltransferase family 4 protein [Microcella sp.]|uniref:glycosyltransferase family 4 protein n=1 Tax=Microcella sp. TaxID=1913979 RepID=UPI003F71222E